MRGGREEKEKDRRRNERMKANKLDDNLKISPTLCMLAVAMSVCISCGVSFVRNETNCIK